MYRSDGRTSFGDLAKRAAEALGTQTAFFAACVLVLLWLLTGPLFGFSDTWQLVINTGTTIVTFLMVFLIQNTQNRDAKALHLKLDELIRAVAGARNQLIDLQNSPEESIAQLVKESAKTRETERPK